MKYKHCVLKRQVILGYEEVDTVWLPERFAKVGFTLKLKEENGGWSDGWKVIWTSKSSIEEDRLPNPRKDFKSHKKETGDSELKSSFKK